MITITPQPTASVDSVAIQWLTDDADLEFLEKQDQDRFSSYGATWNYLDCKAVAVVKTPELSGGFLLNTIASGGVWGIESDSEKEHLAAIERDQFQELIDCLKCFGINTSSLSFENARRD